MRDAIPVRAERLARWSLAPWERAAVLGDLQEEARAIAVTIGDRAARHWYWRQAVVSVWPNVLRRAKGDERRWSHLRSSSAGLALWMFILVIDVQEHAGISALRDLGLVVAFSLGVADALFKKQWFSFSHLVKRRLLVAWAMVLLAVFACVLWLSSEPALVIAAIGILILMRGLQAVTVSPQSTAPEAYVVSHAGLHDPDRDRYFSWRVPNEAAGLSDLVLCRTTEAFDLAGPSADAATIQRRFSSGVTLRVCSAVNLTSAPTTVHVEIRDSAGGVVWSKPAEIRREPLTEMPDNWDELADRDAATHFGAVDEPVSLQGLPPGHYTLRMTATNGERTTIRTDQIEITV
jgi:hypothetical protein